MCDQTEVQYLPGQVVWAKINQSKVWWPGQVQDQDKLIEEHNWLFKKPNLAIVKFFDEDTYSFVKTLDDIYHYNSLKKTEFIKKGLGRERRAPAGSTKKFSQDIILAEKLTGGNQNILNDPKYATDEKKSAELTNNAQKGKVKNLPKIKSPGQLKGGHRNNFYRQCPPHMIPGKYKCPFCWFSCGRFTGLSAHIRLYRGREHPQRKPDSYHKRVSQPADRPGNKTKKVTLADPVKVTEEPAKLIKKKAIKLPPESRESAPNISDEESDVRNRLLMDWDDQDEADDYLRGHAGKVDLSTNLELSGEVEISGDEEEPSLKKSCFDFEEGSNEALNLDERLKFGQKLPRVISMDKGKKEDMQKSDIDIDFSVILEETSVPNIPTLPNSFLVDSSALPPTGKAEGLQVLGKLDSKSSDKTSCGESMPHNITPLRKRIGSSKIESPDYQKIADSLCQGGFPCNAESVKVMTSVRVLIKQSDMLEHMLNMPGFRLSTHQGISLTSKNTSKQDKSERLINTNSSDSKVQTKKSKQSKHLEESDNDSKQGKKKRLKPSESNSEQIKKKRPRAKASGETKNKNSRKKRTFLAESSIATDSLKLPKKDVCDTDFSLCEPKTRSKRKVQKENNERKSKRRENSPSDLKSDNHSINDNSDSKEKGKIQGKVLFLEELSALDSIIINKNVKKAIKDRREVKTPSTERNQRIKSCRETSFKNDKSPISPLHCRISIPEYHSPPNSISKENENPQLIKVVDASESLEVVNDTSESLSLDKSKLTDGSVNVKALLSDPPYEEKDREERVPQSENSNKDQLHERFNKDQCESHSLEITKLDIINNCSKLKRDLCEMSSNDSLLLLKTPEKRIKSTSKKDNSCLPSNLGGKSSSKEVSISSHTSDTFGPFISPLNNNSFDGTSKELSENSVNTRARSKFSQQNSNSPMAEKSLKRDESKITVDCKYDNSKKPKSSTQKEDPRKSSMYNIGKHQCVMNKSVITHDDNVQVITDNVQGDNIQIDKNPESKFIENDIRVNNSQVSSKPPYKNSITLEKSLGVSDSNLALIDVCISQGMTSSHNYPSGTPPKKIELEGKVHIVDMCKALKKEGDLYNPIVDENITSGFSKSLKIEINKNNFCVGQTDPTPTLQMCDYTENSSRSLKHLSYGSNEIYNIKNAVTSEESFSRCPINDQEVHIEPVAKHQVVLNSLHQKDEIDANEDNSDLRGDEHVICQQTEVINVDDDSRSPLGSLKEEITSSKLLDNVGQIQHIETISISPTDSETSDLTIPLLVTPPRRNVFQIRICRPEDLINQVIPKGYKVIHLPGSSSNKSVTTSEADFSWKKPQIKECDSERVDACNVTPQNYVERKPIISLQLQRKLDMMKLNASTSLLPTSNVISSELATPSVATTSFANHTFENAACKFQEMPVDNATLSMPNKKSNVEIEENKMLIPESTTNIEVQECIVESSVSPNIEHISSDMSLDCEFVSDSNENSHHLNKLPSSLEGSMSLPPNDGSSIIMGASKAHETTKQEASNTVIDSSYVQIDLSDIELPPNSPPKEVTFYSPELEIESIPLPPEPYNEH